MSFRVFADLGFVRVLVFRVVGMRLFMFRASGIESSVADADMHL